MNNRFENKVAVVTGGASGIGEAIVRRISAEGGQAVIFDIDETGLSRLSVESQVTPLQVDVSKEEEVIRGVQAVVDKFGKLDIMIHSAGIVGPTSTKITDYSTEDFLRVMQTNLFSAYYLIKHAVKPMLEHNYGRILLISSMAGKEGNPGMVGYSTSKAGLIGLVKAIGKEYADTGITVNGLAPAVIRTPMNEKTSAEQLRYLTERIPMKRLGTVAEAASLACWIVSEEASFNTGFIFDLSGGRATY
jgi:NAD(P)-dependent dehydrogenase (short-subunit alcohol dehydrogenase family)